MIKATINYDGKEKDLFLFTTFKELGARKIGVNITVSETLEIAKKNQHVISNHYFRELAGIKNEYIFDGDSRCFETVQEKDKDGKVSKKQVEVENPLKSTVEAIVTGKNVRKLYSELMAKTLSENKLIIKTEIIL